MIVAATAAAVLLLVSRSDPTSRLFFIKKSPKGVRIPRMIANVYVDMRGVGNRTREKKENTLGLTPTSALKIYEKILLKSCKIELTKKMVASIIVEVEVEVAFKLANIWNVDTRYRINVYRYTISSIIRQNRECMV